MLSRLSDTLEHYMDALSARQKVVASNIANAERRWQALRRPPIQK